jgi:hypothetical protein
MTMKISNNDTITAATPQLRDAAVIGSLSCFEAGDGAVVIAWRGR